MVLSNSIPVLKHLNYGIYVPLCDDMARKLRDVRSLFLPDKISIIYDAQIYNVGFVTSEMSLLHTTVVAYNHLIV